MPRARVPVTLTWAVWPTAGGWGGILVTEQSKVTQQQGAGWGCGLRRVGLNDAPPPTWRPCCSGSCTGRHPRSGCPFPRMTPKPGPSATTSLRPSLPGMAGLWTPPDLGCFSAELATHGDLVQGAAWSRDGALLGTTCKVRVGGETQEGACQGLRHAQLCQGHRIAEPRSPAVPVKLRGTWGAAEN